MTSDNILGPSALQRLQSVFGSIDTDGSGTISRQEFKVACEQISMSVSNEELRDFIGADVSGDGELDFKEFCGFYVQRLGKVFGQIDEDGSGSISTKELKKAFDQLGFQATEREVKSVLSEVDRDKNEAVDFNEFCNFFCSLPSPNLRSVVERWASGASIDTGSDLAPPPLPPASQAIWLALLAGGVAGVVSRTATAPLEKIKIMAQLASSPGFPAFFGDQAKKAVAFLRVVAEKSWEAWGRGYTTATSRAQTSGQGKVRMLPTLSGVLRTEGMRGLFAGNGANCLRVLPFSALVCLAYFNLARNFPLDKSSSRWNPVWRMGAGAVAGVFATLLTHPMDVVRARLTVQTRQEAQYKGMLDGLSKTAKREKLPGLYRGIGPTLLAIAPFMAVQQVSYDVLKGKAMSRQFDPSPLLFFACGSMAGAAAQSVIYPLEVVRRRMQVHSTASPAPTPTSSPAPRQPGLFSLLRTLSLRELFAGLTPTFLKVMPAAAVSLLVRDAVLGRLKKN